LFIALTGGASFGAARAACREDPREVHFSKGFDARYKSLSRSAGDASDGKKLRVELYTLGNQSASMAVSG
jgi:hypothetical protein